MKKMIFFLLLVFTFITNVQASAECEIVMDADSGRILHAKNITEKKLIASTTKIMTTK